MATTISDFLAVQRAHEGDPNVYVSWVNEETVIWTKAKAFGMYKVYTHPEHGVLVVKSTRRNEQTWRSHPRYVGGSAMARKLAMQTLAQQSGGTQAMRDFLVRDLGK